MRKNDCSLIFLFRLSLVMIFSFPIISRAQTNQTFLDNIVAKANAVLTLGISKCRLNSEPKENYQKISDALHSTPGIHLVNFDKYGLCFKALGFVIRERPEEGITLCRNQLDIFNLSDLGAAQILLHEAGHLAFPMETEKQIEFRTIRLMQKAVDQYFITPYATQFFPEGFVSGACE